MNQQELAVWDSFLANFRQTELYQASDDERESRSKTLISQEKEMLSTSADNIQPAILIESHN